MRISGNGKGIYLDAAEASFSLADLQSIRWTTEKSNLKIPSSARFTPTSISRDLLIHQSPKGEKSIG